MGESTFSPKGVVLLGHRVVGNKSNFLGGSETQVRDLPVLPFLGGDCCAKLEPRSSRMFTHFKYFLLRCVQYSVYKHTYSVWYKQSIHCHTASCRLPHFTHLCDVYNSDLVPIQELLKTFPLLLTFTQNISIH